jgi:hypothetical protein
MVVEEAIQLLHTYYTFLFPKATGEKLAMT